MADPIVEKIDNAFFGGFLRLFSRFKKVLPIEKFNSYKTQFNYNKSNDSLLTKLATEFGSDKGETISKERVFNWKSHNYVDVYSMLFDHCRKNILNVFECGIGTNNTDVVSNMGVDGRPGASLRMWREYFPSAHIYGADIDPRIMFEEDRISTYHVDQTDTASIEKMWQSIGDIKFDLIVDDGLHTFEGGRILFENAIAKLSDTGIYSIEDVSVPDLIKFQAYFANKNYNVSYVNLFRSDVTLRDNSIVLIRKMIF